MTLERRPVTALKGVGPTLAKRLSKLGIESVVDLLFWLPTRYEDRTHIVPIGSLRPGMRAAVEGTIELAEVVFRGRRSLLVRLSDGTGFLTLRFFHERRTHPVISGCLCRRRSRRSRSCRSAW